MVAWDYIVKIINYMAMVITATNGKAVAKDIVVVIKKTYTQIQSRVHIQGIYQKIFF